jgi:hypothetical protein
MGRSKGQCGAGCVLCTMVSRSIVCGIGIDKCRRPYSLRRGVRRRPFSSHPRKGRGDGAPDGASCSKCAPSFTKVRRLPALHRGFSVPGTVTSGRATEDFSSQAFARLRPHRVQPFKAAGRRAGGQLPEASRVQDYEPCPQAPHPVPSSKPLAKTPLGGPDGTRIYTLGILSRGAVTEKMPRRGRAF